MTSSGIVSNPPTSRLHLLALSMTVVALALPVLFYRIAAREVSWIVEERVAITSREMWRSGEWILPTLNGEPRLQKPPLAYWLPQLTATARGVFDEITLRLPFAVLAAGSLLFTFGIGCLLLGPGGGLLAATILLTTPLFIRMGHRASVDSALLFCTLGAWYFHVLARHRDLVGGEGARPGWARFGFFVFMGLGALVKGPVIVVLVIVPILIEAAWTRSRDPLRALWSPGGIAVFLLLSLTWPVLVTWRLSSTGVPSPIHQWYLEFFGKALPSSGVEAGYVYSRHAEPWHFYLGRLVPVFGVWGVALPFVLYGSVLLIRRRMSRASNTASHAPEWMLSQIPVNWFVVVLLLFTVVSEKKSEYMLPLLPAGSIMIAACLLIGYPRVRRGLRALAGLGLGLSVGAILLLFGLLLVSTTEAFGSWLDARGLTESLDPFLRDHPMSVVLITALALLGFGLLRWSTRFDPPARVEPVLPFVIVSGTLALVTAPYTDLQLALQPPRKSVREGTLAAASLIGPTEMVYVYGDELRALPGGMAYYLDRRVQFLEPESAHALRRVPQDAPLLIPQRYQQDAELRSIVTRRSEDGQPQRDPDGYSFVQVINPAAPEKDRVLFLRKKAETRPGGALE